MPTLCKFWGRGLGRSDPTVGRVHAHGRGGGISWQTTTPRAAHRQAGQFLGGRFDCPPPPSFGHAQLHEPQNWVWGVRSAGPRSFPRTRLQLYFSVGGSIPWAGLLVSPMPIKGRHQCPVPIKGLGIQLNRLFSLRLGSHSHEPLPCIFNNTVVAATFLWSGGIQVVLGVQDGRTTRMILSERRRNMIFQMQQTQLPL